MACSDPSGYVEPVAFYNENDPFAAAWLRELIKANLIAPGVVDERSIEDIKPDELAQYTQCHFFAGIGGWSLALRLAGWPDDKPVWTGSCPCQPFSAAGKRGGTADERHLWPAFYHLIRECSPGTIFGEQVASKDGLSWFDTVSADLEAASYAVAGADLCAAGFGAPHIRQRLYFVGSPDNSSSQGLAERTSREVSPGEAFGKLKRSGNVSFWEAYDEIGCIDGRTRPIEPGTLPLAHRISNRVGKLRGYGNAIVAPLAQAFIESYLDTRLAGA